MMKKSTLLYALLFYFLFIGWAITPAQGHIGETCLHKVPSHQHCQGVSEGDGNIMIVDSSDPPKQVGKAGPTGGLAVFSHNGQIYTLPITSTGYRRGRLLFESANCDFLSGDGALEEIGQPDPFFSPTVRINDPGNTVYLEQPGSFAIRNTISQLANDGTCPLVSGPSGVMQNTVIMDPIVDLDTIFTPPFKKVGDAPTLP